MRLESGRLRILLVQVFVRKVFQMMKEKRKNGVIIDRDDVGWDDMQWYILLNPRKLNNRRFFGVVVLDYNLSSS
jgi:hypothetical protein